LIISCDGSAAISSAGNADFLPVFFFMVFSCHRGIAEESNYKKFLNIININNI